MGQLFQGEDTAPSGVIGRCSDCRHSYDWQSKALDGHLILCRCKQDEGTKFGLWCKFLSDPACEFFQERNL